MELTKTHTLSALCTILAVSLAYFYTRLYLARSMIWDRKRQGLPVAPEHSFLFGHLLYFRKALGKLPPNCHYQNALGDIAREHFQHEGCYYIDTWPVSGILLIVISPHIANQMHANPKMSMQRPTLLPRFFKPIAGGPNMFDMREHEWKPWRSVFSKAFSAEHVLSLVPNMVDETMTYCETLQKLAKEREVFHLDFTTLRFTIDIIGKTMLNAHLEAQKGYNALADCMLRQIRWHQANAEANPFEYLNVIRKAIHWWNGRQMDKYVSEELTKRYGEHKADSKGKRPKAVIDLVLQAYIAEDALYRLRREHDDVLNEDVSILPALLKSEPHLINDLPYTTAVIKETLRLFPPGSCSRAGQSSVTLKSDTGKDCPTENVEAVFILHSELQRSPVYWHRPDEFLPERWLVGPDHELYPVKGAYRPFEIGPRNCVAQGLAMTELKVVLACIARTFDFAPAYDEFDSKNGSAAEVTTYRGERAYQIEEGAAHPADHLPCRVYTAAHGGAPS